MLRFQVLAGNATGSMVVVEDSIVLGRESEGPGRLGDDPELSRSHARISRESTGGYTIEDLSSTNGTLVNGIKLHGSAVLASGDRIEIGTTTLEVVEAPGPAAVDVRAVTVAVGVSAVTPSEAPAAVEDQVPAPSPLPPLEFKITVDVEHAEATIALAGGDPVTLRVSGGRWQHDSA
jgi:pSer/pThr/pTyr-binding forkhead associated (FHA) protein